MRLLFIFVTFVVTTLAAVPVDKKKALPGPDENGVYPYIWFPENDAPDNINFRWLNNTETPGLLDREEPDLPEKRESFDYGLERREYHPTADGFVCNGARKQGEDGYPCTGECHKFNMPWTKCSNWLGTNCLALVTHDIAYNIETCSLKCGEGGYCSHITKGHGKLCYEDHATCFNVPGTNCVHYNY